MSNEQAEELLLGSVLKDNSILEDVILLPEHFLDLTNRNIYKSMLAAKRKGFPINGASIKDDLGETGFLFIGGNERLKAYMNAVPSIHAFKSYQKMIVNQWKISTAQDLLREAVDGQLTVEGIQTLIKDLSSVDEQGTQEDFNLKEHLKELNDLITVPTPNRPSGIMTGYLDIDQKRTGFNLKT